MKQTFRSVLAGVVSAVVLCGPSMAPAQTAPSLGAAQPFAILGASAVTNTGSSIITGDLGISPNNASSITGFPPGTVSGTIHAADAVALSAQNSLTTAYNSLTSQPCTTDLTGQDLGGRTLTAGVYCFDTSAGLTGTLTLNAQGNPDAVFIFKIGSTLTTASASSVVLSNSARACNVFWQIGSSATLGTTTSFVGNILAQASISLNSGASVTGRTMARTGAVTLISNTIDAAVCTAPCPPITLSPATLPDATQGVAYSQRFAGSGGTAPYAFAVTAGNLPAGLRLTVGGVLSGTPTAGGSSTFTVQAVDANGCFTERTYTMTVIGAVPTLPQWITMLLAMVLLGGGFLRLRRRQTAV